MKSDLSPLLFDDAFSDMDTRDELTIAVLRGARAMAVALEDRNEASDAVAAAEATERLDLTVRLTAEMIRLHDNEVDRIVI
jgi:hypothetical protein